MKYIRLNNDCDFIDKLDSYIIINNAKLKRHTIKKTLLINTIMDYSINHCKLEELISNCCALGYNKNNVSEIVSTLVSNEILEVIESPVIVDMAGPLIELQYNYRYGLEIASFKYSETPEYDRFNIFENIQDTELIIVGIGGVGSNLAVLASSVGIKKIKLIDDDIVDKSNLGRQIFFLESDCGITKKGDALKRFLNNFNSDTEVEVVYDYIKSKKTAEKYIYSSGYKNTIVIQTANEPLGAIQTILNDECIERGIPILFINASTIGPFYIPGKSACYNCLTKFLNTETNNKFSLDIEELKKKKPNVYSASSVDTWLGSSIAFKEIQLYLKNQEVNSCNAKLKLTKDKVNIFKVVKEPIPKDEYCMCMNKV